MKKGKESRFSGLFPFSVSKKRIIPENETAKVRFRHSEERGDEESDT